MKNINRPNIVFIISDDQGPWAAGCYGNTEIRTPAIDRIAQTGMRFDNFFVATPVCSPSRATFLTGRIPSQHGVHDWIREGNVGASAAAYLAGEVAYTDILAANGWVCGLSGKWHLGHSQLAQHGFSHWYVHQQGGGPYNDAPMIRDGELNHRAGLRDNGDHRRRAGVYRSACRQRLTLLPRASTTPRRIVRGLATHRKSSIPMTTARSTPARRRKFTLGRWATR